MKKYFSFRIFTGGFFLLFCLLQIMHLCWSDREIQIRDSLLCRLRDHFSETWQQSASLYGISPFVWTDASTPPLEKLSPLSEKKVLLISGLDDPGFAWQNLAPVLAENGFSVFVFTYPNDQSIEASTELLYKNLTREPKDSPLVLVCHSMGGLIARNLLTRADLNYTGKTREGIVPAINTLIMIGTPHQGSHLARFRIFLEIRDQLYQWRHKNKSWLHYLMDGTGSAGIQLLPGSSFLQGLNQRGLPSQVKTWMIYGRLLPFSGSFCDLIGDGLVTSTSAQGTQGSVIQVPGSHMGMVRNFSENNKGLPSAIPVILDLLSRNENP